MLKIRLRRMGAPHKPFFRVVVSDSRKATTASAVEEIGYYDPRPQPPVLQVDRQRIDHWVGNGAQMSATLKRLIKSEDKGWPVKEKKAKAAPTPEPAAEEPVEEAAPSEEEAAAAEPAESAEAPPAAADEKPAEAEAATAEATGDASTETPEAEADAESDVQPEGEGEATDAEETAPDRSAEDEGAEDESAEDEADDKASAE